MAGMTEDLDHRRQPAEASSIRLRGADPATPVHPQGCALTGSPSAGAAAGQQLGGDAGLLRRGDPGHAGGPDTAGQRPESLGVGGGGSGEDRAASEGSRSLPGAPTSLPWPVVVADRMRAHPYRPSRRSPCQPSPTRFSYERPQNSQGGARKTPLTLPVPDTRNGNDAEIALSRVRLRGRQSGTLKTKMEVGQCL